ncbi:hypothetical protein HHK36_028902 [Tetracentron sinense]|uniref:DNA sliding clamp PCNA n=1 Tax=Tetracentron sinense TaxID=13715 RepID=A0A835D322_TETSI|nr:hypothetical protein HHK36_028902 [Tetracentron sinense]
MNVIWEVGCCEAIIDFSSTTFSLQAKDSGHVNSLALHLNPNAFDHFHCDQNISIGIAVNSLFKILECASVTIKGDNSIDTIFFIIKGPRGNKIVHADLKLLKMEHKRINIHKGAYKVVVEMPSEHFIRVCMILKGFSDTVTISVANKRVKFSTKVDNGSADANLQKYINTFDVPEETVFVQTKLTDPVSFTFSLRHFSSFMGATSLSNKVTIRMSSGLPVMLEYMIEHMANIRFYLR